VLQQQNGKMEGSNSTEAERFMVDFRAGSSDVADPCVRIKNFLKRCRDLSDIPMSLVFGIILYVVDVGSDILCAVVHFYQGHTIWALLTITFVALPAACWAAVSWTSWYTWDFKAETSQNSTKERNKRKRKLRMWLSVLLLDPLTRYLMSSFL